MIKKYLILLVLLGSAALTPPAVALSPSPDAKEPTMDDVWSRAPFIAYGRIVRLELAASSNRKDAYLAVFRVERCWKGRLAGDIVIQDSLPDGAGNGYALQFNRTYILQLAQSEDRKTYLQQGAQELSLPITKTSPSAFSSVVGDSPYLTWVEFLERKNGNTAEAERIRQLRGQDALDREARQAKDRLGVDKALADFRTAMQETGIAERKALLEELLKRIDYNTGEEMVALATKVKAEISLAVTFLPTGRKTFP
ncbi:MAG TPA: hypothetical protein VIO38_07395 [Rariglobus sp.]